MAARRCLNDNALSKPAGLRGFYTPVRLSTVTDTYANVSRLAQEHRQRGRSVHRQAGKKEFLTRLGFKSGARIETQSTDDALVWQVSITLVRISAFALLLP